MRVLFLELDGVANSTAFFQASRHEPDMRNWRSFLSHLDPTALRRLNALDAKIVISSTWRLMLKLPKLRWLLENAGLKLEIIGITAEMFKPGGGHVERGIEIAHWLQQHPEVTGYAIVDDDLDAGVGHGSRFVPTDCATGLQDDHVVRLMTALAWTGRG